MLSMKFLTEFKRKTEKRWCEKSVAPQIYGFQLQAGTRWNPGLSDQEIRAYEIEVGFSFPSDFKRFLGVMNGTDLPTLNIYGSSGVPSRESVGIYAYPRDRERVQCCIAEANENRDILAATLAEQGFVLSVSAKLMPIYAHRYVVCDSDQKSSVVLSIWNSEDAIVYGYSLQEYLEREFLV